MPTKEPDKAAALRRGERGEQAAANYLAAHGYEILARNFRTRTGELDIVAKDGETVVFVEVKTRQNKVFGTAAQAVDYRKQQKIIHTAQKFLLKHRLFGTSCRFDVIEIYPTSPSTCRVHHLINAFET